MWVGHTAKSDQWTGLMEGREQEPTTVDWGGKTSSVEWPW